MNSNGNTSYLTASAWANLSGLSGEVVQGLIRSGLLTTVDVSGTLLIPTHLHAPTSVSDIQPAQSRASAARIAPEIDGFVTLVQWHRTHGISYSDAYLLTGRNRHYTGETVETRVIRVGGSQRIYVRADARPPAVIPRPAVSRSAAPRPTTEVTATEEAPRHVPQDIASVRHLPLTEWARRNDINIGRASYLVKHNLVRHTRVGGRYLVPEGEPLPS